ncbi:cytochrome P450 [Trametopsis cervina]|nr:cytochrome P450 [Trametopsis cervina]
MAISLSILFVPTYPLVAGLSSAIFLHKQQVKANIICVATVSGFALLSLLAPAGCTTSALLGAATRSFLVALCAEALWRISPWHPLARFPGPFWCKVTGFTMASIVNAGHRHEYVRGLHRKHGGIVRIGPNSLSASSIGAVSAIYASSSAMPKAPAYSDVRGGLKGVGMFTMRTKEEHAVRRRTWAAAFSNAAMDKYQPGLERRTTQLLEILPSRVGADGTVDLSTILLYWAFDLLSDVMAGCPRESILANGDKIGFLSNTQQASKSFEVFSEIPWLLDVLSLIPGLQRINPMNVPEAYARKLIAARMTHTCGDHDDLASYLLGEKGLTGEDINMDDLVVDTLLALQAGADTVNAALVLLVYYVLSEPSVYQRLQEELDIAFANPDKPMNERTLSELPFLSAVLEEALRIGSPFHAVPRQVPQGGAMIDGVFVPEDTIISVTSYVMHTAEEYFSPAPEAFRPERWLPGGLGPDTNTNKSAILAFSAGTFGCLGKNLAKRMLRYCTARLFKQYDIHFAPGFDGAQFLGGISHVRATIFEHPLKVVISQRR